MLLEGKQTQTMGRYLDYPFQQPRSAWAQRGSQRLARKTGEGQLVGQYDRLTLGQAGLAVRWAQGEQRQAQQPQADELEYHFRSHLM